MNAAMPVGRKAYPAVVLTTQIVAQGTTGPYVDLILMVLGLAIPVAAVAWELVSRKKSKRADMSLDMLSKNFRKTIQEIEDWTENVEERRVRAEERLRELEPIINTAESQLDVLRRELSTPRRRRRDKIMGFCGGVVVMVVVPYIVEWTADPIKNFFLH